MQSPLWGEHLNQPLGGGPYPQVSGLSGHHSLWPPKACRERNLMARAPATLPGSGRVSCKVISRLPQPPFGHRLSSRAKIAASEAGEYCDITPRCSQQTPLQPADPACPLETKAKVLGDDFGGLAPVLGSVYEQESSPLGCFTGWRGVHSAVHCGWAHAHLHFPRAERHRPAGAPQPLWARST